MSSSALARRRPVGARVVARLPAATRLAPVLASAFACAVALLLHPRAVDSAAHAYRADLFQRDGFTLWNNNWYGGHHSPAYSILFPPLAALIGPFVVGALEAIAATALFQRLASERWGPRAALWGSVWFGLGTSTFLFTGRLTFGLGVMFAVAAALAEQHERRGAAAALAMACSLASPVAGLFLALLAAALFIAGGRRGGLVLGAGALIPAVALAYAFPEGGYEPFDLSTFLPLPVWLAGFLIVVPREEKTIRVAAALYLVAGVAFFFADTPMGGNTIRLGAIVGGPVLACALAANPPTGRGRRVLAGLVLAGFAFWQWSPAVRDTKKALEDPATRASYYRPLVTELERRGAGLERIEIPFTRSHWEAAEVADRFPLARGWERQLDTERNGLFYDGGVLNRATYGAWLAEHGVGYVALPDAKPDYSGYKERGLIEAGLPYLRPVWRSHHWRLFAVTLPHAMVVPDGDARMRLAALGDQTVDLDVQRPGSAVVKVHWSQYWEARGACVESAGEWTRVTTRATGRLQMRMAFAPGRIFSRGRRCA